MSTIDEVVVHAAQRSLSPAAPTGLPAAPHRGLAIVTCMDARLDPIAMLGLAPGDAHILRVPGGIVGDAELRGLAISQRAMGTTEVMIIHHTDCGAASLDEDAFSASIAGDIGVEPAWSHVTYDGVQASVDRVRSCLALPHRDNVRGFMYDVHDGRLVEVA